MPLLNQHLCDPIFDQHGCPEKPLCVNSKEDCPIQVHDSNGCRIPKERNCKEMGENFKACPTLFDSRGCKEDIICLFNDPKCTCPAQSYDENGCRQELDDPVCKEDTEMECEKRKH